MPRDKRPSSRSRSRSPRPSKHYDHDTKGSRRQTDDRRTRDSHHSRSRSKSPETRRSRSPERKRHRRPDSKSPADSRSRSRSRDRDRKRRKHRSKSRSRSRDVKDKRRRDHSVSSSSSSSDDDSHRRKKEKRKDKDRDGKRSKSKERRREKRREKKERKEKKKKDKATVPHWGKYGIISDIDIFNKNQEFYTWLVEERKINPETVSKETEKKEFSRFVEDYNTATLPHEKYYNMDAYEKRMSALRQGEYLPPANDSYDFNADMKAMSSSHKKKATSEPESYMSKEQLMELRRVQNERSEVGRMKLLGMDVKQNFGVRMDGTMFDG